MRNGLRFQAQNVTVPVRSGGDKRSRARAGFEFQFKARADLYCKSESDGTGDVRSSAKISTVCNSQAHGES